MLSYTTLPEHFIVMDYNRGNIPFAPADVVVPLLSEKNMVEVHGQDDQIQTQAQYGWLMAHVRDVYVPTKTCHVHFYIEHTSRTNVCKKESTRIETVH